MPRGKPNEPQRIPLHEQKDKLTVYFTEEAKKKYKGRWIEDEADGGRKVERYLRAGYEFATPEDVVTIGDDLEYNSDKNGTIIRTVANPSLGDNRYLYLMKIPVKYYNEDQKAKQDAITDRERDLTLGLDQNNRQIEGTYGSIKITQ